MMTRWLMAAMVTAVVAANFGCYYDQWQQADRANGILREELSRCRSDLKDEQMMNAQKDTIIEGLNNRLAAKDETIGALNVENDGLRRALVEAQEILKNWQPVAGPALIALPGPLHDKLVEFAAAHPGILSYDEKKGAVRWKSDLLFPSGSDVLVSAGEVVSALREFASIVNSAEASGFDVIVVGHTDTDPIRHASTRFKSNWDLSAYRAIAVMNILLEQNVNPTRTGIMGYSMYRPIADNSTSEGKAKNRRVEIFLVASGSVQDVS